MSHNITFTNKRTEVFLKSKEQENEGGVYRCGSMQPVDVPDNKFNSFLRKWRILMVQFSTNLTENLQQCLKYVHRLQPN
jgi:hypothetical protein